MKKKYEEMTRKELMEIARTKGIKNPGKLKKSDLILAIKSSKKPLKKIKETEEALKGEVPARYEETHLEFLPKEPGTVFVSWEISQKDSKSKEGVLKILEGEKEFVSLPVKFPSGKGYVRVDEGKNFIAVVGTAYRGKFREIVSSQPVSVPRSKPIKDGKIEFGRVGVPEKKSVKVASVSKKMEEEKEKINEEAKKIKYIRYPKEGK
ncbi:MAG: Rho termination factor N-terminal domain-containing protein [Caldisericaceae bacterium]